MMKHVADWVLLSLLAVFASVPAAQTAPMPDLAQFQVGEQWEWRQFDSRTRLQEAAITRVVVEEKGERRFLMDGKLRALDYPYVGELPAKPWRAWPLEIGKQWSNELNYVRADGVPGVIKSDVRVVAHEEVEVPAGRFMAFRIQHDGFVTVGNWHGRIAETWWYAPAARADVKLLRKVANVDSTRELVTYPRPGDRSVVVQGATAATPPSSSAAAPSPNAPPTAAAAAQPAADSHMRRLRELEQLRKEGLITPQEYEDKRKAILSTL